MAIPASGRGEKVFVAQSIVGVYEHQAGRTEFTASDCGRDGDLLVSLLTDLMHYAWSVGIDFDTCLVDAESTYKEHRDGPVTT